MGNATFDGVLVRECRLVCGSNVSRSVLREDGSRAGLDLETGTSVAMTAPSQAMDNATTIMRRNFMSRGVFSVTFLIPDVPGYSVAKGVVGLNFLAAKSRVAQESTRVVSGRVAPPRGGGAAAGKCRGGVAPPRESAAGEWRRRGGAAGGSASGAAAGEWRGRVAPPRESATGEY